MAVHCHSLHQGAYVIADEERIGVHFVAAHDHPLCKKARVSIHDLAEQPFLLTEKGMSYRRLMDEMLARHNVEIFPVLEFGRPELICSLVEKGVGISFLPDYVTEEAVQAGRMMRIAVEGLNAELWKQLLYHRGKWMSLPLQAVINHLAGVRLCADM